MSSYFGSRSHSHRTRFPQIDSTKPPDGDAGRVTARNAAGAGPSHAEIAGLAYSYWEARGRHEGSPLEDWFRAERELRERMRKRGAVGEPQAEPRL
jgi:hypothetical protein